jgi:hypothetical protein
VSELRRPDQPTDDRWEWIELPRHGGQPSDWIPGRCRHTEIVPVKSVTGEVVARLCLR